MCDFPNVENNVFELEALSAFCEDWNRRIVFLGELSERGRRDEALILCCCYIEAIGTWFTGWERGGKETFAMALLTYAGGDIFSRINPWLLFEEIRRKEDTVKWEIILDKLESAFTGFNATFYPSAEITEACRSALSGEEFTVLDKSIWMGTMANPAYSITKCEGVHNGSATLKGCGEIALDFQLFYPALQRVFEVARRLIMSGKIRVY